MKLTWWQLKSTFFGKIRPLFQFWKFQEYLRDFFCFSGFVWERIQLNLVGIALFRPPEDDIVFLRSLIQIRVVWGILLEFAFTICQFKKLFLVSQLFCRYIRDLKRKCSMVFFELITNYFSVNAMHNQWCKFGRYFQYFWGLFFTPFCGIILCFWGELIRNFFSVFRYHMLLGGPETCFAFG